MRKNVPCFCMTSVENVNTLRNAVDMPPKLTQELDNDLRAWSDQDLALASLLSVVDALERIVEDRSASHSGGGLVVLRFSMAYSD